MPPTPPTAPMMTKARLESLAGAFITPTILAAFQNIKARAEDPAYEAYPDPRLPLPSLFKKTAGLDWLSAGHPCVLYAWGEGSAAAIPALVKLAWIEKVAAGQPTRDETTFQFTQVGAEAFADLMYPGQRLALHRSQKSSVEDPSSISASRQRQRP